jgi:CubicO group peptidase (beta-lactamase class C family)
VRIKDILQMSSGASRNEDYSDWSSDINRFGRTFALGRFAGGLRFHAQARYGCYPWRVPDASGGFSAVGIDNQLVYVSPAPHLVIVKTSAKHAYGRTGDEASYRACRLSSPARLVYVKISKFIDFA